MLALLQPIMDPASTSFRAPALWDVAVIGFLIHSCQEGLSLPSLASHIVLFSKHLTFHCHHQSFLWLICHPELSWLWDPGASGLSVGWLRYRPGWDPGGGAGEQMRLREISEMLLQRFMTLFFIVASILMPSGLRNKNGCLLRREI